MAAIFGIKGTQQTNKRRTAATSTLATGTTELQSVPHASPLSPGVWQQQDGSLAP